MSAPASPARRLTFERARVQIDVSFWLELRRRKLEEWRLREPAVSLTGRSTAVVPLDEVGEAAALPSMNGIDMVLSRASFDPAPSLTSSREDRSNHDSGSGVTEHFARPLVPGQLKNYNALADLTNLNAADTLFAVLRDSLLVPLLQQQQQQRYDEGETSQGNTANFDEDADAAAAAAWRAGPFLSYAMHAYVDAKGYRFHHREAFPVMSLDSPVTVTHASGTAVSPAVVLAIRRHSVTRVRQHGPATLWSPFLCVLAGMGETVVPSFEDFSPVRYVALTAAVASAAADRRVLICFHDTAEAGSGDTDGACDLATAAEADVVSIGWHMRNFLLCLRLALPTLTAFSLFAIRHHGRSGGGGSLLIDCACEPLEPSVAVDLAGSCKLRDATSAPAWLRVSGWRKTSVHYVDIRAQVDQTALANDGALMNLELMKWRQLPDLDLAGLASCRALLLGTGTLGCNIARNLLMWGVRHLTLVDRGSVSYSNLARQSLFTASDAAGRGREKTVAAADALRAIIPTVHVEPVTMTIHMPGHRVDGAGAAVALGEVDRLAKLIASHDVVFLLTDSWEARWLPTVLAAASNTPAINVALGFDSYVVMRHGMMGSGVRCYFCSDLSAPTDSVSARPLDQQCTVTRPGVSAIASALAVELLAAMYQLDPPLCRLRQDEHGNSGDCSNGVTMDMTSSRLGVVPHQIRGDLFTQSVRMVSGERNTTCTACSDAILNAYRRKGSEFILHCINDPSHIERVSGLDLTKARYEAQVVEEGDWSVRSFGSGDDTS